MYIILFKQDDKCFIDEQCFNAGDLNPNNPDEICDPDVDPRKWTPRGRSIVLRMVHARQAYSLLYLRPIILISAWNMQHT